LSPRANSAVLDRDELPELGLLAVAGGDLGGAHVRPRSSNRTGAPARQRGPEARGLVAVAAAIASTVGTAPQPGARQPGAKMPAP
jgi:hypothetical protein